MITSDALLPTCETPSSALGADAPVAGRYRLEHLLGKGGCGEVHAARDLLTGAMVAVKQMLAGSGMDPARVRREVRALRALKLPGVVDLVDEGLEAGRSYLVMELVHGAPFPGLALPTAPEALLAPTQSLLATLARVHEVGVVHRDLKPGNVLVDAAGRVTLLDFGLAAGTVVGDRITADGFILGTLAYLAPEQVTGAAVGARADLYAVGVMLFEALTGRLPFDARDTRSLLLARVTRAPMPVRALCPGVPDALGDLVDALLSRRPEDRPRSAADALAALAGHRSPTEGALPFLGREALVAAAEAALEAGRTFDVVGRAGQGRTRLAQVISARLEATGRTVVRLFPARRPFGSLGRLADALMADPAQRLASLDAAVTLAEAAVTEALAAGVVLVADDAERLDRYTQALLERVSERGAGGVLRLFAEPGPPGGVTLAALAVDDLRALFTGAELVLHLPSDAARLLHRRTAGVPSRVVGEVESWVSLGLARWVGDRLRVDRPTLDRLLAAPVDIPSGGARVSGSDVTDDEPELREHLGWLALAGPRVPARVVQAAMGVPAWAFEAGLRELEARGWARSLEAVVSGTHERLVELQVHVGLDDVWTTSARQAAHRALADRLPVGSPGRLYHRFATGDTAGLADEVAAQADAEVAGGRVAQALAALAEGASHLRAPADAAQRSTLLARWAEYALLDGSTAAIDAALYEVCRVQPADAHLEALLRAAVGALGLSASESLSAAVAVPVSDDLRLEIARRGVMMLAARRYALSVEEQVLSECLTWAEAHEAPEVTAAAAFWEARVTYRRTEFDRAALRFEASAAAHRLPTQRLHSTLRAASCWMEAFDFARAHALAAAALGEAASLRHGPLEARAHWLLRTSAYRAGAVLAPCPELVEATNELGVPALLPLILLTEAAIAWRAGDLGAARTLAVSCAQRFEAVHNRDAADLARALAAACGAEIEASILDQVAERAPACPYALTSVQTLGLLAHARPERAAALLTVIQRLATECPPGSGAHRLDVISAEEALVMADAAATQKTPTTPII